MAQLFIVPTPIGNLGDITFRAIEVLKSVDLILAEDTRTSGKLLKYYEIETPLKSHHMHNEHKISDGILSRIEAGETMALITDAGSPGISDPGYLITRKAVEKGIVSEEELEQLERRDILDFVFHPGFSTASEVTDVSGRGVGMDIVKNIVKKYESDQWF